MRKGISKYREDLLDEDKKQNRPERMGGRKPRQHYGKMKTVKERL